MATAVQGHDGEAGFAERFVGPPWAPDRYRLVHPAGSGGEGEVWAAEQRLTETATHPVAVKILSLVCPDAAVRSRKRWEDQVARVRLLSRPGITRVFESFGGPPPHAEGEGRTGEDAFYVVMEWVSGPSLEAWLREQPDPAACLELAIEALLPVAQALDYMHRDRTPGRSRSSTATSSRPTSSWTTTAPGSSILGLSV